MKHRKKQKKNTNYGKLPPLFARLYSIGLIFAAIAFVYALTPSLIPRDGVLQGVVAGVSAVATYSLYAWGIGLWKWLGFPYYHSNIGAYIGYALSAIIVIYGLSQATDWQNSVYFSAGLDPVESVRPYTILFVSIGVFLGVVGVGRIFGKIVLLGAYKGEKVLPLRASLIISFFLVSYIFWSIGNGVFVQSFFAFIDRSSQQVDALIPITQEAPENPLMTGSESSLIAWNTLGSKGRDFISGVTQAEEFEYFFPDEIFLEPLRVYAGLNSAETLEERAQLFLEEMIRVEAFSRSTLVLVTPTGTGWIDPKSIKTLELLLRGDVATVGVQYSYLPSWLTLLSDYEAGEESARKIFEVVYTYWSSLPSDERPELYLHGLSLGSRYSENSSDVWDIIADPYNGALWVGPTYGNTLWNRFTRQRNEESSYSSPTYGDDSLVRFFTQFGTSADISRDWGIFRILYFQHPSDAVTFFSPQSFWRAPKWMSEEFPPDISSELRFIPVVTFFQLLTDNFTATSTRAGHGHTYATKDYFTAWYRLLEPTGISEERYLEIYDYFLNKKDNEEN
ncbi:alpha/beta-hydrolase family protein [Candidatus Gracilibacteria bacterium]|nr:alpha/beta-hydrolase family protein [Candidatus Gracilibacteria bacterium]